MNLLYFFTIKKYVYVYVFLTVVPNFSADF